MSRYVCVHGHFYQPPRENPWLEAIQRQESAAPYHDWNERVAAEAYAPNAAARILDERDRILGLVNNYERISFDVGPTLMSWLETESPEVYRAILKADSRGAERNEGHGPAIAQAYGHAILPLSNDRDRRTQVVWGIREFEARFGRRPEGMWLPETAVDLASLDALAAEGIRYTILAPHQAARWRPLGGGDEAWRPGGEAGLDPRRAYLQRLPSGREIALFFYDGPLARGVAFEGLLRDGARFADGIVERFDPSRDAPQLVHLATDGETFGHHHRHGEMALAFALDRLRGMEEVRLVTFGRFLELHPPAHEVEIVENSSWSCAHGVERWRADCGCHTGGEPGWDQRWREPLRAALDALRGEIDPAWEEEAGRWLADPWSARDAYVEVILDRSPASVERFLAEHAREPLPPARRVEALELLELQRHALLMYTSCGWFFHDLAGIETVQVLWYAARAVELAERRLGLRVEEPFVDRLAAARSNRAELGDGRAVWERLVRPARVDLTRACVNHAVRALVEGEDGSEEAGPRRLYAFLVEERATERHETGRAALRTAVVRLSSRITGEAGDFLCAALHLGEHSVVAGARPAALGSEPAASLRDVTESLRDPFAGGDFAEAIRRLGTDFGPDTYSLADLLRDEQVRIVDRLLRDTLEDAEAVYERLYERHAPLMRFVGGLGAPQPAALELAGAFVLERKLRRELEEEVPDLEAVGTLIEEAGERGVELATPELQVAFRSACLRLARRVERTPRDPEPLRALHRAVELAKGLPIRPELWEVQNAYWGLLGSAYPESAERAEDEAASEWVRLFLELGRLLGFAEEAITPPGPPPKPVATPPAGSWR